MSFWNFPYFLYILGFLVFFLPGLNLALTLEQITRNRQKTAKIFLWSFLFSLTLTPAFIYIFSSWQGRLADEKITLLGFGVWWFLSFVLFLGFYFWKKFKPTDLKIPSYKKHKVFWWALGIFFTTTGIHFLLYHYIPEVDPYYYLIKIQDLVDRGEFLEEEPRFLFHVFSYSFLFLTKISLYWLFKIFLPLLAVSLVVVFYQISQSLLKTKLLQLLATLSFMLFPVLILEILIPRPQSLFLVALSIVLYLATNLLKSKRIKDIYWFLLLLAVSFLGIKIHQFFIFSVLFVLLSLIVFLWPQIKKHPLETFLIVLFVLIGFYPWSRDLGVIEQAGDLLKPFWRTILHPKLDLWFIDNYINIDGNRMGWPGYTWIYYYGYNLGIVLPILALVVIVKKIKIDWDLKNNWLYLVSFLVFFSIAEFFPRLGLAFLPDRAWLFASLSLVFFIPILLKNISKAFPKKFLSWGVVFLLLISFLVSWGITYTKQGWATSREYEAAQFIKENLPKDAAILTQGGNFPMVAYFSERLFAKPPEKFFLEYNLEYDLNFLESLPEYISRKAHYLSEKESLEATMRGNLNEIILAPPNAYNDGTEKLLKNYKKYQKIKNEIFIVEKEQLDRKRPIYILYSRDKFTYLYGQREWWKKVNFYGANLKKFDQNPEYFEKIYDKNKVIIWKVKN